MTYSCMLMHTTIGACAFHFRVRDGIGWFHTAIVTRERVEGRRSQIDSSRNCAHALVGLPQNEPESARHRRISWDVANLWLECRRVVECQGHLRLYGQASRAISTG